MVKRYPILPLIVLAVYVNMLLSKYTTIWAGNFPPMGRQDQGFWYEKYLYNQGMVTPMTRGSTFDGFCTLSLAQSLGISDKTLTNIKVTKSGNMYLSDFFAQVEVPEDFLFCLAHYNNVSETSRHKSIAIWRQEFWHIPRAYWRSLFGNIDIIIHCERQYLKFPRDKEHADTCPFWKAWREAVLADYNAEWKAKCGYNAPIQPRFKLDNSQQRIQCEISNEVWRNIVCPNLYLLDSDNDELLFEYDIDFHFLKIWRGTN